MMPENFSHPKPQQTARAGGVWPGPCMHISNTIFFKPVQPYFFFFLPAFFFLAFFFVTFFLAFFFVAFFLAAFLLAMSMAP